MFYHIVRFICRPRIPLFLVPYSCPPSGLTWPTIMSRLKTFLVNTTLMFRDRLSRLSFRTGVIVLSLCVPFYVISFAQMALPVSPTVKAVLWVIFFGLAKTAQYGGLTILGVEGVRRVKAYFKSRRNSLR